MKRIGVLPIVIVLAAIGGAAWWYFGPARTGTVGTGVFASGFIEARQVSVSFDTGGRVTRIAAAEGDTAQAGAVLANLDDSVLLAQLQQATASLEQARLAQQGARKAWDDVLGVRTNPLELEGRIVAAEGQFEIARVALDAVLQLRTPNWLQEQQARAQVAAAEKTLQNLLAIRANPQELNARVNQAQSAYLVAEAATKASESYVGVIKAQVNRLVCVSPGQGSVVARHVEPGEVVQAGQPVLTIADLREMTLTVYVAESVIGRVELGQQVSVTVDSYPGEDFSGTVVFISPRAEFTPRNVQVQEERAKTVFAVKIRLPNPDQKLKQGMPADAVIRTSSPAGR